MEIGLNGEAIRHWDMPDGFHTDVVLFEPNGDSYKVECLIRPNGCTDIGGNPDELFYLNQRYGPQRFCTFVRAIASQDA